MIINQEYSSLSKPLLLSHHSTLIDRNFEESLNTLLYANRAKNIQNTSKKNETNTAQVVKELRQQIEKLKEEMSKGIIIRR